MLEQLELLLRLSVIDGELQDLMLEYESLPGSIEELEGEKEGIRSSIASREAQLDESAKERKRLERDLEDLTAKLSDLESKRIQIKTNEEYAALSLEMEHARANISDAEDKILKGLETAELVAQELETARAEAQATVLEIDQRVAALRTEVGRLDDAVAIKRDERLRVAMLVDDTILDRYDRILESKGDSAVAPVSDGACSGCRMKLPPQTLVEIKRSDRLMECQSCGRILCWVPEGRVE